MDLLAVMVPLASRPTRIVPSIVDQFGEIRGE